MTTQNIIIYRNPLEAAMWESLMNGGFSIVLFVIAAFIFWLFVQSYSQKMFRRFGKDRSFNSANKRSIWVANILTLVLVVSAHIYNVGGF